MVLANVFTQKNSSMDLNFAKSSITRSKCLIKIFVYLNFGFNNFIANFKYKNQLKFITKINIY